MSDEIHLSDRAAIERAISGGLKAAINAHGPITLDNHSSASKRVFGALKQYRRTKADQAIPKAPPPLPDPSDIPHVYVRTGSYVGLLAVPFAILIGLLVRFYG